MITSSIFADVSILLSMDDSLAPLDITTKILKEIYQYVNSSI